jgi:alpha-1,6-mannosyltransferase
MTSTPTLFATSATRWGWLILSACLFVLLGYTTPRGQFPMLIGLYTLLMWGYSLRVQPILRRMNDHAASPDRFLFGSALVFRLLLLLAMPRLSDDYARFMWDGQLLLQGINPFRYLPVELMAGGIVPAVKVDPALYQLLNSPNYYTVYPPVNQLFFAFSAWLSPGNAAGGVIALRLPIMLAEMGTLWLMTKLLTQNGHNPNLALLYGLNPLIILELTGNVHFEAVMIFFTLLAVYYWQQHKQALSALALSLAIATKLLPLMLLPLVIAHIGWQKGLRYAFITGGFLAVLFIPFFNVSLLMNMLESIDLYFRKFEFNASVYYVIRQAGYWLQGYNVLGRVGLWLSLLTTIGLTVLAFAKSFPVQVRSLWMLTLYLIMATTVHPWYITSLVAVSVFASSRAYSIRYVLVWSALVWLSYSAYRTTPVSEDQTLLLLEYGPVFALFILDTRRYLINRQTHAQTPAEI